MSDEFRAIFEHGVLRPLQPPSLVESEQVIVVVRRCNDDSDETARDEHSRLRDSLAKAWACGDGEANGFSGRDHDRELYGDLQ